MKKLILAVLTFSLVFVIGCNQSPGMEANINMDSKGEQVSITEQGKMKLAQNKISGLARLAHSEKIIVADVETLEEFVRDDEHALEMLVEIKALVKGKEYEHSSHALSMLDSYLRTKKDLLCPAHELQHYYVFIDHNDAEIAQEAFNEAIHQMDKWVPTAREYDKKYPSGENFDRIVSRLKFHITQIEDGNSSISDEELEYLEEKASICVEED